LRAAAAWLVAAAAPWQAATAEPAAWQLAGRNGGEIALLGSMHVLRAADYPLPASIDALFERADVIVMELDLDDVDALAQQATVLAAATLSPGTVLRDVVEPRVYSLTEQRTRELGLDLALLERFEPWFLAITLLDLGMRKVGFQAERGVEQYLVGKAREAGKNVIGLETFAMQIGLFDAMAPSAQQAMLSQTLEELTGADEAMTEMVAAWRDGRLDALSEELLDDFDEFPGLYDALVTDRNTAWVAALEDMLDDGRSYLVVVGALHLVGRDSVIDMLQARGHRVARLH
jgi:hypothetical protein